MTLEDAEKFRSPEEKEMIKAMIEDIRCASGIDIELLRRLCWDRVQREWEENDGKPPAFIKMPGGNKHG